jgi:hypothetical protein
LSLMLLRWRLTVIIIMFMTTLLMIIIIISISIFCTLIIIMIAMCLFFIGWKNISFLVLFIHRVYLLPLYDWTGTPRTSLINAVNCRTASTIFSYDSPVIESSFCHCLSPNLGNLKGY